MVAKYVLLVSISFLFSCKNDPLPKPTAQLRLEYPKPIYKMTDENCSYRFEQNTFSTLHSKSCTELNLHYPTMKADVFITYKKVENNITELLQDAEKLTYDHALKADGIAKQPFINSKNRVYGMFYEVMGNAASQTQFYVTDSTQHFLSGSLYFYVKPNYDSILPATAYVKNDMRKIMETLQWDSD